MHELNIWLQSQSVRLITQQTECYRKRFNLIRGGFNSKLFYNKYKLQHDVNDFFNSSVQTPFTVRHYDLMWGSQPWIICNVRIRIYLSLIKSCRAYWSEKICILAFFRILHIIVKKLNIRFSIVFYFLNQKEKYTSYKKCYN